MLNAVRLALALLTVISGPAPIEHPNVDGALIDGGAHVKLDHVLVIQHSDEEGWGDGPRLRIFLTSGAIPLSIAGASTTLSAATYAKQSKIYGVVILADPSGKTTKASALLLNTPPMTTRAPPGFAAKTPDPEILRRLQVDGLHVSGEAHVDLTRGWVTASFDTSITPDPVTQNLTGSAAIESAPAKVFLAYQDAASKGDMAEIGKYSTSFHALLIRAFHDQMGDAAFIRFANSDENMKALPNSIERVVVRGESASIVFKLKEVAGLVLEDGVWKVNE
jgi:hypothetical protein